MEAARPRRRAASRLPRNQPPSPSERRSNPLWKSTSLSVKVNRRSHGDLVNAQRVRRNPSFGYYLNRVNTHALRLRSFSSYFHERVVNEAWNARPRMFDRLKTLLSLALIIAPLWFLGKAVRNHQGSGDSRINVRVAEQQL